MGLQRKFERLEKFCSWYFSRDPEYCEHCRKVSKNKPPCDTCKWGMQAAPPLSPLEEEIFQIYQMAANQLRTSFGGVVGLDYNVFFGLFEILGIDKDERFIYFQGIKVIESHYLKYVEEKQKKEEQKSNIPQQDMQLQPKSIMGRR